MDAESAKLIASQRAGTSAFTFAAVLLLWVSIA
jgi:hypothetical protein